MKLYRGFNNNYPDTLGVRPEQKGIWLTDDEDFAKVYAEYFKNGAIAEVELDDNANIANEYDCMNVFEDDEDWQDAAEYICDLGADVEFDNRICDKLAQSGYDGVMFDDNGVDCYYVFNRKMIKGSKVIKTFNNKSEEAMESLYEGLSNKPVSFTAYHGGVEPDMTPDEGRAFYLTDSYELAHQFARREIYDDGLYEGEIPTVFTFKGTFNNPYYLTDDEYDDEGQDSNIDYDKWIEMGVDGLVYAPKKASTYYIVIDLDTIKMVDKKVYWEEEIKDDDIEESVNNHMLNVLLESNILTEDIAAVKKYFPKVPEEKIQTLIELDPTYTGGDNLGKFGKWILGLYNKGNLKDEDFYKVPQYLTTFKDNLKKIQNKDIMSYKTLPDLAQAIQDYEGQKDVSKKQQVKQLKSDEAEKVLETSNWLIIHPKTHKADCYYGANTKWCTASKDNDSWFENYNSKGPLYILINKKNGKKYQFHFETLSFMNELDRPVSPNEVTGNDNKVWQWCINNFSEKLEDIVEKYNDDGGFRQIYCMNGGLEFAMYAPDCVSNNIYTDSNNVIFEPDELGQFWSDSGNMYEFWEPVIKNYVNTHEDFAEEVEEAVIDYTNENAFISKNNDCLFGIEEFRKKLIPEINDLFIKTYCEKIESVLRDIYGDYQFDGSDLIASVSEEEAVEDLMNGYSLEEVIENKESSYRGDDGQFDYAETDLEFQKDMEKLILKTIKDWSKSDNQMEFNFAAESINNWKNPFLED